MMPSTYRKINKQKN